VRIRIELIEAKTPHFKNVLRLCRRFPTYKTFEESGLIVHSIDFTDNDLDSYEAIEQMIFAWKGASYHLDGKLVSRARIWEAMSEAALRRRQLRKTMDQRRQEIPTLTEFLGESDLKN
jgi:hypothetical protein